VKFKIGDVVDFSKLTEQAGFGVVLGFIDKLPLIFCLYGAWSKHVIVGKEFKCHPSWLKMRWEVEL